MLSSLDVFVVMRSRETATWKIMMIPITTFFISFAFFFSFFFVFWCKDNFVFSLVKDREATDDITQNIFMNIWDRRKNLDKDLVFRSYLYASARNAVYDWFRRSDKIEKVGIDNASGIVGEDLSKVLDDEELLTMVNLAVIGMPETRKRIFILSRIKGLKNREIAEEVGVSINTVEYHISKALEELRKLSYLVLLFF